MLWEDLPGEERRELECNSYKLIYELAKRQKIQQAKEIIDALPEVRCRLNALAFLAKGLNDLSILKKAIFAYEKAEKPNNYIWARYGVAAAEMGNMGLARTCMKRMNDQHSRQTPIWVLLAIAKATQDSAVISEAKTKLVYIPKKAEAARAKALIGIALALAEISQNKVELMKEFAKIEALAPEYRIEFHLRLLGLKTLQYFGEEYVL